MSDSKRLCTFSLAGFHFGLEVEEVQEVLRFQEMTRVPLAAREVEGLINLRGQIVTAIDLRRRLGMPPLPADQLPMNVVVRTDDGAVSLLVDQIGDVVEVDDDAFEAPPETLTGLPREVTRGVYKLNRRLLLILDIARILSVQHTTESERAAESSARAAA
jgi:purine-binding chemotaxis protein CheW